MKPKIIIIAGATATGKSDVAAALAQRMGGEVISADSMQIYKHMTIGTAKPSADEIRGVPHHLIDELLPDASYSAAIFQDMAKARIADITARGNVPIVCGGTGFYVNALLYETDFTETVTDETFREEMQAFAEANGAEALHARLAGIDPDAAAAIHANNIRRVIRALEYHAQTGRRISQHNEAQKQRESAYDAQSFLLTRDRALLYERIERRVDKMLAMGLVDEVKALLTMGYQASLPSMQGLGYKEIVRYLQGEYDLAEAVRVLKRDTRHFAKRQLTWFTHQSGEAVCSLAAGEDTEETTNRLMARLR